MKILLGLVLSLAASVSVLPGAIADTPFIPEVANKFNAIERQTGTSNQWQRQVRAVYDTSVGTNGATGSHGLGVYLPAKATITRGWMYIVNSFNDVGSGTVAITCEDAGNIFTAADITGHVAGSIIPLNPQDGQNNIVRGTTIAATCEVTATVATADQATGKAVILLDYFVAE